MGMYGTAALVVFVIWAVVTLIVYFATDKGKSRSCFWVFDLIAFSFEVTFLVLASLFE